MSTIRIASFDVGKKNFAEYVEDVDVKAIKKLERRYDGLPTKMKRRVKGDMNDDIESILDQTFLTGTRVHMGVYDLRSDVCVKAKSKGVDMETRRLILNHLHEHREIWETCDIFVVEQQFMSTFTPAGRKNPSTQANIDAIKIGELVMAWILTQYPFKEVVHYGSQFKTQTLGAPNSLTKPQRKKWSIEKAKAIFEARNDTEALDQMTASKKGGQKQDDVADACIQCQSYKFREMVAMF